MRLLCMVAAVLAGLVGPAAAQDWPDRPIRWIVPYPPGGGTDIAARLDGERLGQQLGKPVVIDNRPGGNTIIGTGFMARAEPDGYTIGLVTDAFSANIALDRKMPYDSLTDLVPVVQLLEVPFVLEDNQVVGRLMYERLSERTAKLSADTVERISYVMGIYKALRILLPTAEAAHAWVKKPNAAYGFAGKSALERMLGGRVVDLADVRRYLDAERG